ncbi:hypothetical protein LCGC14_2854800, partial [marine sediment metagenome]
MKPRKKARRRGRLRRKLAALAAALIAAAVLLAFSPLGQQFRGLATPGPPPVPSAAIVDQTSTYDANPEFVAAATDTLEAAGYVVDYYPGEQVTVDLYRELPAHGYDLILLRVHSARVREDEHGKPIDEVVLFTSEPYTRGKHLQEQATGGLALALYHEGGDPLFGIRAGFVTSSMRGDFNGATVIMMGCNGLTSVNATAMAFLGRGAESFTSWDDLISWGHSDAATLRLLELMLVKGLGEES